MALEDSTWEIRAEIAGPMVDLQGKALKAALEATDPAAREAYLRMSAEAERAFLQVVPEARIAMEAGVELERIAPRALLAFADELSVMIANENRVAEGMGNDPAKGQQLAMIQGLETAAELARKKAGE